MLCAAREGCERFAMRIRYDTSIERSFAIREGCRLCEDCRVCAVMFVMSCRGACAVPGQGRVVSWVRVCGREGYAALGGARGGRRAWRFQDLT